MCGVVAVSLTPGSPPYMAADRLARNGIRRLMHRGPDGCGVIGNSVSAIAMSRLRVRSRHADRVPFAADSALESFAYNGELYSVETADGARVPMGGLDEAEAVCWHDDSRLDGMYALVRRTPDASLRVARDPMGIKPLFLRWHQAGVAVASEIPALLEMFGQPAVRSEAIAQFLLLGRVVDGGTFFDDITPVRPGERLELARGRVARVDGGSSPRRARPRPIDPAALRVAVAASVERILVADRPVGLAVSGGLDSTVLAAELSRLGVENLATVSVVPENTRDGVRALHGLGLPGTAWRSWRHRSTEFGPNDLLDGVAGAVAALAEPTAMTSVPMYAALARLARDSGVVVLLLGEGADELFSGYRSYLDLPQLTDASAFYVKPERSRLVCALLGRDRVAAAREALVSALPDARDRAAADVVREFEYEHSLEPLLRRADHLLMAEGIEGRTPFLHGELPRMAPVVPAEYLTSGGQTKVLLRRAYAACLPHFLREVKRPFRAPVGLWLAGATGARARSALADHTDSLEAVGVRPEGVAELLRSVQAGRPEAADLGFALLTLGAWLAWLEQGTLGRRRT